MKPEEDKILNDCIYVNISTMQRIISQLAEKEFASTGWTTSYALIIHLINQSPGITVSEIAGKMNLAVSTVTRFIEKLEFKGYVKKTHRGRKVLLKPLKKSKEIEDDIIESWLSFKKKYEELLGKEIAENLNKQLGESLERINGIS